jgi:hypothetical protein
MQSRLGLRSRIFLRRSLGRNPLLSSITRNPSNIKRKLNWMVNLWREARCSRRWKKVRWR